jgi:hypothetical protein
MKGMKNLPFLRVSLCVHGAFTVRFFQRKDAKSAKEKAKDWKRGSPRFPFAGPAAAVRANLKTLIPSSKLGDLCVLGVESKVFPSKARG